MKPFPFLALIAIALVSTVAAPAQVRDIGSRRELFVDYLLIDHLTKTELKLQRPVDRGHALDFDKPWEGVFCAYVTILHPGDKYQAYYRGASGKSTSNTGN